MRGGGALGDLGALAFSESFAAKGFFDSFAVTSTGCATETAGVRELELSAAAACDLLLLAVTASFGATLAEAACALL